jgi:hypothetical protein
MNRGSVNSETLHPALLIPELSVSVFEVRIKPLITLPVCWKTACEAWYLLWQTLDQMMS